jgi:hypothetical protein
VKADPPEGPWTVDAIEQNPEVMITVLSAIVALFAALASTRATVRITNLQHQLELQRARANKELLVEEVMTRYREPLLRAAFDLQSRIFNIYNNRFLDTYLLRGTPDEQEYAVNSTLFLLADYFGWVEIVRRGVQYLELGDSSRNRGLAERLEAIRDTFAATKEYPDSVLRVLRVEQRALGELMIQQTATHASGLECVGFAHFTTKLESDPEFERWFGRRKLDVHELAEDPGRPRLRQLQHDLVDLIDFLDPGRHRFPDRFRSKLPTGST